MRLGKIKLPWRVEEEEAKQEHINLSYAKEECFV